MDNGSAASLQLFIRRPSLPMQTRAARMFALGAGAIALGVVVGLILENRSDRPALEAAPRLDAPTWAPVPATLAETGLYADWATKTVSANVKPFTPQYPLWSDGARKRRWIYLPGAIDTSDPQAWVFPVGTRLWKEFSFGARAETRFMIRATDGWRFATYVWTADGSHAIRAPRGGADTVHAIGAARTHRIPSAADCSACHENGKSPVLGFDALQLSVDRDPNAVHREEAAPDAIDLAWLVEQGLVRDRTATIAARIAGSTTQRAALGYLHGNCGGCHRAEGPLAGLGMTLANGEVRTIVGVPSKYGAPALRVAPGDPGNSVLLARMKSRHAAAQMPPIGTVVVDEEAIRLVASWIDQLAQNPGEVR